MEADVTGADCLGDERDAFERDDVDEMESDLHITFFSGVQVTGKLADDAK